MTGFGRLEPISVVQKGINEGLFRIGVNGRIPLAVDT
jgi:hypothetical protein